MKLSDLQKVETLKKERDYLRIMFDRIGTGHALKLGNMDIRPDIVAKLSPALKAVIVGTIARVDDDLAALGVTVEDEAAL